MGHLQDLPVLGVGFALRQPTLEATLASRDVIDWVEITADNHIRRGGHAARMLQRAYEVFPLVSHSFGLSLGSVDPFEMTYVQDLKAITEAVNSPWISDHLCFCSVQGTYAKELVPLPRTRETVLHVADRIKWLQDTFQRPFLFENVCYYFEYPQNKMPEHAFLSAIAEEADCGLLLDLNNLYVNATNFKWDAMDALKQLPLERVVQVHVSGCMEFPECLVDVHGGPLREEVWEMLDWLLQQANPAAVMLEWDFEIPEFEVIRQELWRIRRMWDQTQPAPANRKRLEVQAS